MANIIEKMRNIRNSVWGKDVRENIASGIESINEEVINTTGRQGILESVFNGLTINAGSSNSEIVSGRTSNITRITSDSVGHRIDDIEYITNALSAGGQNLLTGTKNFEGWSPTYGVVIDDTISFMGLTPSKATGVWSYYSKQYVFELGKTYTLSAWVKSASGAQVGYFGFNQSGEGNMTAPTTWTRWTYTFTIDGTVHPAGTFSVRIESADASSSNPLWVAGISLTEGVNGKMWTPSPSDQARKRWIDIRDLGAKGDALFYDSVTNKYYTDAGCTSLPTPFSDILNLALLTAQSQGKNLYIPSGIYLIDKQIILRDGVDIICDIGKTILLISDTFLRYDDYVFRNENFASLVKKDSISFDGISIVYEGHVAPTFSDIGIHGVLFKFKNLSKFVFVNSSIKILNKGAKPLVTCIWFRGGCSNIEVYNSYIENTGCANEGGNIWISTNDSASDINDGIKIHDNIIIKHSGDELLAIWGIGTNKNINFSNNKLVYESNAVGIICAKLITVFTYSIGLFENIYIKDNSIELKGKVSVVFNSGIKSGNFNNVMYDNNVINDYVGDATDLIAVCKIEPIDIVLPETTYEEAYARGNIIYSNNTYTNYTSIGRRTFASVTSSIIKLYNNIVNSKFSNAVIFEESGNSKILSSGNYYNYDAIAKYASIFSEIRGQNTKAYFAKDYIKFSSHLYLKLGGSSATTNTLVEFNSCNVRGTFALMSIQQAGSISAITSFINNTFEAAGISLYYGDNQYLTKLGTLNFINNTLVNATPLTTSGSENVTSLVKANSTINISGNKWGNNATDYSSATAPTNVGIYKIFPEGKKILNIGVGSHAGWVKKSDDSWRAYYGLDGGTGTEIPETKGTITVTMDSALKTLIPDGNCILNATGEIPGKTCKIAITTSGTTSYIITFAENFKTTSTLDTGTVDGKIFIVSFICINYIWVETGRTLAI